MCQVECQNICQIECQNIYQIDFRVCADVIYMSWNVMAGITRSEVQYVLVMFQHYWNRYTNQFTSELINYWMLICCGGLLLCTAVFWIKGAFFKGSCAWGNPDLQSYLCGGGPLLCTVCFVEVFFPENTSPFFSLPSTLVLYLTCLAPFFSISQNASFLAR